MKIIGLDVGTARIGVAKADSKVKIAVPAGMIPIDGEEFEAIARLARVYGTNLFVLGLPRSNDGYETKQSAYVRDFAEALKSKIEGAKIYFQDESLTSVTAKQNLKKPRTLKEAKARKKAGEVDSEAAVIILQDFLEHFAEKIGEKLPREAKKNTSKGREKTKKRSKNKKKALIISLITLLVLLCGAAGGGVFAYFKLLEPLDPTFTCERLEGAENGPCANATAFLVPEGASTSEIANLLAEAELIKNPFVFQVFTKLNGYDSTFQAGNYYLNPGQSVAEIVETFKNGPVAQVFRFTILPGETIMDVKDSLKREGYSSEEIEAAFSTAYDHPVLEGRPAGASLEGYLFGETYEFFVGESIEHIITTALDQLDTVLTENGLKEAFAARGLSLFQAITLASIVQKEAAPADMATVAQVFYNRMAAGMILGSDVTTQYSLALVDPNRSIYTDNAAALEVEDCHNTRKYGGLPCGPISNPGLTALLAVAQPAASDALYFLTGDDSVMYYSKTESEHNAAAAAHCQVLCNVAL